MPEMLDHHDYLVYGLRLRSARVLPRLPLAMHAGPADVTLIFDPLPPSQEAQPLTQWERAYVSSELEGTLPVVTYERSPATGSWRLSYGEGVRFTADRSGRRIAVEYDAPLDMNDVLSFLAGPVLGLVLRRRGILVLHASGVVIDGMAVGCLGAGGAGKSTLAAALAARGHAVLTDDVLALRRDGAAWLASPGYPELRLWDSSEPLLFGSEGVLERYSANWDKRALPLVSRGYVFHGSPVRLGGLVLLESPDPGRAATVVVPGEGTATLLALLANTYVGYLLNDSERRAELSALGAIAAGVPLGHLVPAAPDTGPEALAEAVERWARTERGVRSR